MGHIAISVNTNIHTSQSSFGNQSKGVKMVIADCYWGGGPQAASE